MLSALDKEETANVVSNLGKFVTEQFGFPAFEQNRLDKKIKVEYTESGLRLDRKFAKAIEDARAGVPGTSTAAKLDEYVHTLLIRRLDVGSQLNGLVDKMLLNGGIRIWQRTVQRFNGEVEDVVEAAVDRRWSKAQMDTSQALVLADYDNPDVPAAARDAALLEYSKMFMGPDEPANYFIKQQALLDVDLRIAHALSRGSSGAEDVAMLNAERARLTEEVNSARHLAEREVLVSDFLRVQNERFEAALTGYVERNEMDLKRSYEARRLEELRSGLRDTEFLKQRSTLMERIEGDWNFAAEKIDFDQRRTVHLAAFNCKPAQECSFADYAQNVHEKRFPSVLTDENKAPQLLNDGAAANKDIMQAARSVEVPRVSPYTPRMTIKPDDSWLITESGDSWRIVDISDGSNPPRMTIRPDGS